MGEPGSAIHEALGAVGGDGEFLGFGVEEDCFLGGFGEGDGEARGCGREVEMFVFR